MKDHLLEQAGREHNPTRRAVVMLVLGPIFLYLLPWFIVWLGARLDHWLQLPPVLGLPFNWILGLLVLLPSGFLGVWSVYRQYTIGRGTPLPLMATRKLVVQPPYTYCRNPMALGAFGMYLGVAILFHSIGAGLVVLFLAGLLLTYIKLFEEKETENRFGQEYVAYKRRTPFLIPRFWSRP